MSVPPAAELARRQRVRDDMIKAGERQCNGCSRVLPLDQMRNGKCDDGLG